MCLNFLAALICDASNTGKASEVIRNHGCISLIVYTDDRGVVYIGTYNVTYLVRYSSRLGFLRSSFRLSSPAGFARLPGCRLDRSPLYMLVIYYPLYVFGV